MSFPSAMPARYNLRLPSLLFALFCGFLMCAQADADQLTGTWRGSISGDKGDMEAQARFSEAGYLIFTYTNNRGVTRDVEFDHEGQKIQYVPRGGGVSTWTVKEIKKESGSFAIAIYETFEGTNNGYLTQNEILTVFEYALGQDGLEMRLTQRTNSHFSDKELMTGGEPQEHVWSGTLQKVE
jgi:hypothetical protein